MACRSTVVAALDDSELRLRGLPRQAVRVPTATFTVTRRASSLVTTSRRVQARRARSGLGLQSSAARLSCSRGRSLVTEAFATASTPLRPPKLSEVDARASALIQASILHSQIAERFAPEDPVGMFARICAVSAAFEAGSFRRAALLAEHYLDTSGVRLPAIVRDALHKFRTKAMVGTVRETR